MRQLLGFRLLGMQVQMSSRELAILEFIDQMDLRYSFEDAENYIKIALQHYWEDVGHL